MKIINMIETNFHKLIILENNKLILINKYF